MKAIWTIARLTMKEALRNKFLYLLFGFAVVLISLSWVIGKLTIGDEMKIIQDLALSSTHFFGVLVTIFIGISLIFREMEKRTVFLILTKPVQRYQFLLGKFCGLAGVIAMLIATLAVISYVVFQLKGEPNPGMFAAFLLIYAELLLLSGIAIVFSSFSTPLLSSMMTLCCFFAGHLSSSLLMLQDRIPSESGKLFLSMLYYTIPNLELFNIRAQVVHKLPLTSEFFVDVAIYWILYLSALLLFSIRLFQKKDLV